MIKYIYHLSNICTLSRVYLYYCFSVRSPIRWAFELSKLVVLQCGCLRMFATIIFDDALWCWWVWTVSMWHVHGFSPWSHATMICLGGQKATASELCGQCCAQPMEGAEGAAATAFARAPGQGESVSHTENKVKPLCTATIIKDVRKDETFRDGSDGISRNDTMILPGWTHSRLRQAAEAAAVLLPRRLALAFSKPSWWRPCHEAKRPRTMGASPAVPDASAAYCSSRVSIRAVSVTNMEAQHLLMN